MSSFKLQEDGRIAALGDNSTSTRLRIQAKRPEMLATFFNSHAVFAAQDERCTAVLGQERRSVGQSPHARACFATRVAMAFSRKDWFAFNS